MPDVYVYVADQPIHRTVGDGLGGVHVDLAENGAVVGVECLGASSVSIDGQPVVAPSPTVDREVLAKLMHVAEHQPHECPWPDPNADHYRAADALLARYDIRERGEGRG
jgi:hypothetical protein